MYKIVEERFQGLYQKYCEAEDPMTEYDYYLTAVKEDGVSLFDVPYVYQTNELIMIALETSEKPKGQGTGTKGSKGQGTGT